MEILAILELTMTDTFQGMYKSYYFIRQNILVSILLYTKYIAKA